MSLVAALLAGLALLVWCTPPAAASRLAGLSLRSPGGEAGAAEDRGARGRTDDGTWPDPPARRDPGRTGLFSGGCGLAVAIVVGGWAGLLCGAIAAGTTGFLLHRSRPRAVRVRRERLIADVPLVAELMAVTLRAGRPPERAVEVIAHALPGPLGHELALVAESMRLGAPAEAGWERLLAEPGLAPFARAMVRSWDSGAPLGDLLERLARDYRRTVRAQADRRARSVGVKAAAPLGLCFLPAFVLIGIVPLVAGAIGGLLPATG